MSKPMQVFNSDFLCIWQKLEVGVVLIEIYYHWLLYRAYNAHLCVFYTQALTCLYQHII